MNKLSGKVAVVTGASKGMGASVAEHLAGEGASVVVNGKAIAVQANVAKPKDIEHLFSETKKAYGKSIFW